MIEVHVPSSILIDNYASLKYTLEEQKSVIDVVDCELSLDD